mmetsp:Transcript_33809/g.47292  ORF Transcript_33809/g.47292 Transcript_33809/m.47292 type:complete len:88 (-) Transcript_33809:265-528(-)
MFFSIRTQASRASGEDKIACEHPHVLQNPWYCNSSSSKGRSRTFVATLDNRGSAGISLPYWKIIQLFFKRANLTGVIVRLAVSLTFE